MMGFIVKTFFFLAMSANHCAKADFSDARALCRETTCGLSTEAPESSGRFQSWRWAVAAAAMACVVASNRQLEYEPHNANCERRWWYRDPKGTVRGPFTVADMQRWDVEGYFGPDLPVRCSSSTAFAPLRVRFPPPALPFHDVREHIPSARTKVIPPPRPPPPASRTYLEDLHKEQHRDFALRASELEAELSSQLEAELEVNLEEDAWEALSASGAGDNDENVVSSKLGAASKVRSNGGLASHQDHLGAWRERRSAQRIGSEQKQLKEFFQEFSRKEDYEFEFEDRATAELHADFEARMDAELEAELNAN